MLFFFKSKTVHLDCFTYRPEVYEYYPIDYSHKFYPDWWKKLPKNYTSEEFWGRNATMKTCLGFNLFYSNSITIPLWTDMDIKLDKGNSIELRFADQTTTGGTHSSLQSSGMLNENEYSHFKLQSPWRFTCKEEVRWTWTQTLYNFYNVGDIIIPPGIVDYKYQHGTNINMFINLLNNKKLMSLDANQPLVNITPLSEKKVKLHTHLVDEKEFGKISLKGFSGKFINKYLNGKKINQEKEQSKCPFHF